MKLSQVTVDDTFVFDAGQKPAYVCDKNNGRSVLDNVDKIIFICLQRNKKSVVCRMRYGSVKFTFKFAGVFNNYESAVDYDVQVIREKDIPLYQSKIE